MHCKDCGSKLVKCRTTISGHYARTEIWRDEDIIDTYDFEPVKYDYILDADRECMNCGSKEIECLEV
jgi:hypothetical protein